MALSVLVTHCLGNVYVSLEFAGKRGGDKAKFVAVPLWLTDNTLVPRGWRAGGIGGCKCPFESQRAVEVSCWQLKVSREKRDGEVFVFTRRVQKCVTGVTGSGICSCDFLTRYWKQEMKGNAAHWKCLDLELGRFLSAHCMFIYIGFCTFKIGSEAAFTKNRINPLQLEMLLQACSHIFLHLHRAHHSQTDPV